MMQRTRASELPHFRDPRLSKSSSVELLVLTLSPVVICMLVYGPYLMQWGHTNLMGEEWQPGYPAANQSNNSRVGHCSFATRRAFVQDTCDKHGRENVYWRGGDHLSVVGSAFINLQKKILYCRISQAGIHSVKTFFNKINSNSIDAMPIFKNYRQFVKATQSKQTHKRVYNSFVFVKSVPVRQVIGTYGDFKKIMIIGHPLRRIVSAYYQLFQIDKNLQNFTQFVEQMVLTDDWLAFRSFDYQESCHPCVINYDYIIKQETLESEIHTLNDKLHIDPTYFSLWNQTLTATNAALSHRRIDQLLQDFNKSRPDLFEKLRARYSLDMEMFGYTWHSGHSRCKLQSVPCC